MGKIKQAICRVLSNRKVTGLIIVVIIISRILQLLFLFNTRNDMSYQIQAAQALYDGHGLSLTKISADDISTVQNLPLVQWPPGFSVLFLPFYTLSGHNYLAAALALNILSAMGLIFFTRKILKLFDTPLHVVNLFSIFTGFSLYYFYLKPCTDSTAITIFIMAVYYTILLLKSNQHVFKTSTAITITLLVCGLIKYLYVPVLFVLPLLIIVKGFFLEKVYLKKAGGIIFSLILIAFLTFFIWQKFNSGAIAYINEPERGFYPENLLSTHPYLTASFIKPETIEWFVQLSSYNVSRLVGVFQGIHLMGFISLILYGGKQFLNKDLKATSGWESFLGVGLLSSVAVTALLTWLSLTVAKENVDAGIFWTYVEEPRYYGVINVLLHMGAFLALQVTGIRRRARYLVFFVFACMFIETVRGMVFSANRLVRFNQEQYGWQRELKFQQHVAKVITSEKAKQNIEKVVLTGTSDWFTLRAGLYCRLPVFKEVNKLNSLSMVKTKKPVLLFAIIRRAHVTYFGNFVNSGKTKHVGSDEEFLYYTQIIMPT